MPVCLQLLRAGVPAYIEGRNVGDRLAGIVKKVAGKKNLPAVNFIAKLGAWLERVVSRISTKDAEVAEKKAQEFQDLHDTLKVLAEDCEDSKQVLQKLETLFDTSNGDSRRFVVLSTVHKGKGLEWDRVFVLKSTLAKVDWESSHESEEQNIGYVAITRARKHLTWVLGTNTEAKKDA
jgi:superfamily I DNA/RNA helicase